jgi:transposase
MTRFISHRQAASWAKLCPGNHESAGKRRSGRTGKGNRHRRAALTEAAQGAARTENTYLRAQYEQIKRRGTKPGSRPGHPNPDVMPG